MVDCRAEQQLLDSGCLGGAGLAGLTVRSGWAAASCTLRRGIRVTREKADGADIGGTRCGYSGSGAATAFDIGAAVI